MSWWRRLLGRQRATSVERRGLSVDDLMEMFRFNGVNYPILNTSYGQLNEESIGATLNQVAKTNGIVFSLMMARLQLFSQARFQWTRYTAGSPGDLFGNSELDVLERPWQGGTTADLLARMEVDVTCAGNAYVRRLRRNGQDRLILLRPEWMFVILGSEDDADHPAQAADVELIGYAYKPPSSEMRIFLPEEIAHYAPYPDPDAVHLGMSWITPAIRDVSADNMMTDHKRAFLKHAATPNMVIKFDPAVTVAAVKEFKELFEAEHAGFENAWKTVFMGGGADAQVIGKDFQELEFGVTQGKGEPLALDTPIPTPTGWTTMGEIQAGDMVLGRSGAPACVLATSEVFVDRQCYRITLKNGETLVADASHPWMAVDRNTATRGERKYTTQELYELFVAPRSNGVGGHRLSLPEAPVLDLPEADLLVDPYVLGAWLGDGQTAGAAICGDWEDLKYIAAEIEGRGYTTSLWESGRSVKRSHMTDRAAVIGVPGGLLSALDALGVLGGKRIPEAYLRGSAAQRLSLLQGLMDTDGSVSHTGKSGNSKGQCEFSSKDEHLARQALELVRSLGYRASITRKDDSRSRTGEQWRVRFRSRPDCIPFLLPRKVDRCVEAGDPHFSGRRSIVSIDPVDSVPVRCITVDTDDHLFLAGDGFVPTHNSRLASAAGVPPSWVGFSEGLQGSALNAGNFTAARRRLSDGTLQHLWGNASASLETIVRRPPGANLWVATKGMPFLHMDAQDAAQVQSQEAATITALVRDGFTAESAILAVQTSDWSQLDHTGRLSVQLQTPGEGDNDSPSGNGNQEGARDALLGGRT